MLHKLSDDFGAVLHAIYAASQNGAEWPGALRRIGEFVGADGGMIIRQTLGRGGHMIIDQLDPELDRLYLAQYTDNPFARRLSSSAPGNAVLVSTLADMQVVRRTAFYADVLAPQQISDMVAVPYAGWNISGETGGASFVMGPRRVDHASRALKRLQNVVPHLIRALDMASVFASRASQLEATLELWQGAVAVCDTAGRVVHVNPAMDALTRRADGLLIRCDGRTCRMQAASQAETRALDRIVHAAAETAVGNGSSVGGTTRLSRPSGEAPYVLCVIPLPPAPALWMDRHAPRVLVFVLDPAQRSAPGLPGTLRGVYGLTAAEAQVASLVARGSGIPSVAAVRGVSVETVRRQVRACFAKTGAASQAELARLVAAVPVPGTVPNGNAVAPGPARVGHAA